MGSTSYDHNFRSTKTANLKSKDAFGKHLVSTDAIFEQNTKRTAHESMLPSGDKAGLREARDSDAHPNSVPIIIGLDITGSMGDIPEHFIREGMPKIIEKLMEKGIKDPQVMFMAIGDSRSDRNNGVFQIGQFESGDKEMDMWLERTWISKGGGGNGGESYFWPYYYAKHHVVTDAWEKRKQKGFIFTIGDDHCFPVINKSEIEEVMGKNAKVNETVDVEGLVADVKEQWNVYHIELGSCKQSWGKLIGVENTLDIGRRDYEGMGDKIVEIVTSHVPIASSTPEEPAEKKEETPTKAEEKKTPQML